METAVKNKRDGSLIELVGRLDSRSCGQVRDAIYAHLERYPEEPLTVDLSGVDIIDATTVRCLAVAALRMERRGQRVILTGYSPSLKRAVTQAGWRRLFVWGDA